jgi:hypothetical protein
MAKEIKMIALEKTAIFEKMKESLSNYRYHPDMLDMFITNRISHIKTSKKKPVMYRKKVEGDDNFISEKIIMGWVKEFSKDA